MKLFWDSSIKLNQKKASAPMHWPSFYLDYNSSKFTYLIISKVRHSFHRKNNPLSFARTSDDFQLGLECKILLQIDPLNHRHVIEASNRLCVGLRFQLFLYYLYPYHSSLSLTHLKHVLF